MLQNLLIKKTTHLNHGRKAVNIVLFYFMIWIFQPSHLKFIVFLVQCIVKTLVYRFPR